MRLIDKIILTGPGLHSGHECRLEIEPCDNQEIIMCSGDNAMPLRDFMLSGTNRGSDYIFPDGTKIRTCEHVLSALTGLGMFGGVKLTVTGGEMPALDGCAKSLCDEILEKSDKKFDAREDLDVLKISEQLIIYGNDDKRLIAAFPRDKLQITYIVEYKYIGTQIFDYEHSSRNYYENISPARTFAMASDIAYLRSHGMALGGNLDNAILIDEGNIRATGGLRWPDEFVRHKVLDLLGDLSSLGKPLHAHIIALRAGHELHLRLAEKLRGE